MRLLKVAFVAFLLLTAAACSDDGGEGASTEVSDEAQPYADALASSLLADSSEEISMDQGQADCLAAKWVNVITVERLEENDIDAEALADPDATSNLSDLGLEEGEAGAMVDGFGECDINLREAFLADMGDGEDVPAEVQECMEDAVSDEAIKELFVTLLINDADSEAADAGGEALFADIQACAQLGG